MSGPGQGHPPPPYNYGIPYTMPPGYNTAMAYRPPGGYPAGMNYPLPSQYPPVRPGPSMSYPSHIQTNTNSNTGNGSNTTSNPISRIKSESISSPGTPYTPVQPLPMTPAAANQIALSGLRSAYPTTPTGVPLPHYANYMQQYAMGGFPGYSPYTPTTPYRSIRAEEDEDEMGMDDADYSAHANYQSQSKADLK